MPVAAIGINLSIAYCNKVFSSGYDFDKKEMAISLPTLLKIILLKVIFGPMGFEQKKP
jgi:hypothetical protein